MSTANPTPRVLLTGASQGVGNAILLALAQSRHFVLGVSRKKPEELAGPLPSLVSDYIDWKPLDLSDAAAVERWVEALEPITIRALILCAVDYGEGGRHPASATSAPEWQRVIATNLVGHCVLVSCLLPRLIAHSPGVIINLSSDVALIPAAGRTAYAASKAGLHAMLRAVAAEHPTDCLRVYQLIPTFQLLTNGIRRRRPIDFDFSSYADPAIIAQVVERILCPSGSSIPAGSYLVRRDGALDKYPEATHI
jgi:NAD(P)-dependent dehydrogenase (short-subunit alcohol dehydrogenase family)